MKRLVETSLSCSRGFISVALRRPSPRPFYSRRAPLSTGAHDDNPTTQRISSAMTAKSKEISSDNQPNKDHSFGAGFLHSLSQVYHQTHQRPLPATHLHQMEAEARSIMRQLGHTSDTNPFTPRAINTEFTAYMVSPYRILKASGATLPEIRTLLEDSLQHAMSWSTGIVREQLDASPDAFEHLVRESKDKEENFYVEGDFKLKRARDTPDSYSLEVHGCWYMNALDRLGAREIGPSFCAFDRSWYDAVDAERHGARFSRPSTIAEGDDRCRFNVDRVKKKG